MLLYHSCPKGYDADVAQSVERRLGKAEVTGPIPVISLITKSMVQYEPCFFVIKMYVTDEALLRGRFPRRHEPCSGSMMESGVELARKHDSSVETV